MENITVEMWNSIPSEIKEPIKKLLGDAALKLIGKGVTVAKDKAQKEDIFGLVRKKYKRYVLDTLGKIQILDMNKSIPTEDLFIPPRLTEDVERFRHIDEKLIDSDSYGRNIYRAGRLIESKTVIEALDESNGKLVVLGDPGAGKSTLLRCITLSAFSNSASLNGVDTQKFPIYIELRRYSEAYNSRNMSLLDYFYNTYEANESDKAVINDLCESGNCIFLLDALDEVSSSQKNHVVREIDKLVYKFSQNRYIVSSRIGDFKENINGFTIYEINEFTDQDKDKFIDKWFSIAGKSDLAINLKPIVKSSKGISELTTNPLLMSLICLLYSRDFKLPTSRAEVYQRCLEVLIREWDTKRGFRRDTKYESLSDRGKIAILCDIAQHFYLIKKRYFRRETLESVISNILPKYSIEKDNSSEISMNFVAIMV